MGVDLTLHVVSGAKPYHYCATRLDIGKDYDLFDALEAVPKSLVAGELGEVWAFSGDENKKLDATDAYGNPFKFSTAGEIYEVARRLDEKSTDCRAAFAYLRELPTLTPIVLDFH
jgi:hypothetical protein